MFECEEKKLQHFNRLIMTRVFHNLKEKHFAYIQVNTRKLIRHWELGGKIITCSITKLKVHQKTYIYYVEIISDFIYENPFELKNFINQK